MRNTLVTILLTVICVAANVLAMENDDVQATNLLSKLRQSYPAYGEKISHEVLADIMYTMVYDCREIHPLCSSLIDDVAENERTLEWEDKKAYDLIDKSDKKMVSQFFIDFSWISLKKVMITNEVIGKEFIEYVESRNVEEKNELIIKIRSKAMYASENYTSEIRSKNKARNRF